MEFGSGLVKGGYESPSKAPGILDTRPRSKLSPSRNKKMRERAKLTEVARLAGVSTSTVSRALNHPNMVAIETQERVRAAISATDYVPDMIAGGLASNRSRMVSVIVPALVHSSLNEMIEAVTEQLSAARYQVMLSLSGYEEQRLEGVISAVLSRRPEAIIVTGDVADPRLRAQLQASGAVVIETRHLPRDPLGYVVGFSHLQIGREVAALLYGLGRRAPLLLTSNTARSKERETGFVQAMSRLGVRNVARTTLPIPATLMQGRQRLAAFLDSGGEADCVFCGTDWQAHGVIIEAQSRGLRTPDDLAVVGFGDMDFCDAIVPGLTSVRMDGEKIGRAAAQILLDLKDGRDHAPVTDVGFEIVRRGSA